MTAFTSQRDSTLLLLRGMRDVLEDYATNRYRRTDRPYVNGWSVACRVYDQLLVDLAGRRGVTVPVFRVRGGWMADARADAERALAAHDVHVRPTGSYGPPLLPTIIWSHERLASRALALATLLANVAHGCLDADALAGQLRLHDYTRPAGATGGVQVLWRPVAHELSIDAHRTSFEVTVRHGHDARHVTGTLVPDPADRGWDLVDCAVKGRDAGRNTGAWELG